jgi:hypothetical protein
MGLVRSAAHIPRFELEAGLARSSRAVEPGHMIISREFLVGKSSLE